MPDYEITSPDGRTVTITGDHEPSQAEAAQIFQSLPARQVAPKRETFAQTMTSPRRWGEAAAGIVRGALTGPARLAGQALQTAGITAPGTPTYLPAYLGGPIPVEKPQGMRGAQQVAGSALQSAALAMPSPAMAGAMYAGGQTLEQGPTPTSTLLNPVLGAIYGRAATRVPELALSPEERAAAIQAMRNRLSFGGASRATAVRQAEIKETVGSQLQEAKEKASEAQTRADQLRAEKRQEAIEGKRITEDVTRQVRQEISALNAKFEDKIRQDVPQAKNEAIRFKKNMTDAFGAAITRAEEEGGEFPRTEWEDTVVRPTLDSMQSAGVPKDNRMFQTISSLLSKEPEEGEEAAAAKAPSDILTAKDFTGLKQRVEDAMRPSAKMGRAPMNQNEYWGSRFKIAHAEFVKNYAPESGLAEIIPEYRETSDAHRWLFGKTVPYNRNDTNGAFELLRKLNSGEPLDETAKNYLNLIAKGTKQIKGLGPGVLTPGAISEGAAVAEREQQLQTVRQILKDSIDYQKNDVSRRIAEQVTKVRDIQAARADITKQMDAYRELEVLKKRQQEIESWNKRFVLTMVPVALSRRIGWLLRNPMP